jgi:hypothetical protein
METVVRDDDMMTEQRNAHCSTISWIELVGSISIAYRLSNPFTFVASLENFWPNASERLCAGSVDFFFLRVGKSWMRECVCMGDGHP